MVAGKYPFTSVTVVLVFPIPRHPAVATMVPGVMLNPEGSVSENSALVMAKGQEFTIVITIVVLCPSCNEVTSNVLVTALFTHWIEAGFVCVVPELELTETGPFVYVPIVVVFTVTEKVQLVEAGTVQPDTTNCVDVVETVQPVQPD